MRWFVLGWLVACAGEGGDELPPEDCRYKGDSYDDPNIPECDCKVCGPEGSGEHGLTLGEAYAIRCADGWSIGFPREEVDVFAFDGLADDYDDALRSVDYRCDNARADAAE